MSLSSANFICAALSGLSWKQAYDKKKKKKKKKGDYRYRNIISGSRHCFGLFLVSKCHIIMFDSLLLPSFLLLWQQKSTTQTSQANKTKSICALRNAPTGKCDFGWTSVNKEFTEGQRLLPAITLNEGSWHSKSASYCCLTFPVSWAYLYLNTPWGPPWKEITLQTTRRWWVRLCIQRGKLENRGLRI